MFHMIVSMITAATIIKSASNSIGQLLRHAGNLLQFLWRKHDARDEESRQHAEHESSMRAERLLARLEARRDNCRAENRETQVQRNPSEKKTTGILGTWAAI